MEFSVVMRVILCQWCAELTGARIQRMLWGWVAGGDEGTGLGGVDGTGGAQGAAAAAVQVGGARGNLPQEVPTRPLSPCAPPPRSVYR